MIGVTICERLDLAALFGPAFAAEAPELDLRRPEDIPDPASVEFALAWEPANDAFAAWPRLRGVFSIAAGVDRILACPSLPDVPVFRVEDPDQALQMAGFATFHVLWHHRRVDLLLEAQAREAWERPRAGRSPREVRVGVMGFGTMGQAIARALRDLGYPVAVLSRSAGAAEAGIVRLQTHRRAEFLARSDILINVLPLTEETRGVLDAELFSALPRGAALVHLGRGAHLDEAALLAALDSGQLAGASLDVFAREPLPPGHPFWSHPRVLVTPHTASAPEPAAVVRSVRAGLQALDGAGPVLDRRSRGY